jgi:hypothetical protein
MSAELAHAVQHLVRMIREYFPLIGQPGKRNPEMSRNRSDPVVTFRSLLTDRPEDGDWPLVTGDAPHLVALARQLREVHRLLEGSGGPAADYLRRTFAELLDRRAYHWRRMAPDGRVITLPYLQPPSLLDDLARSAERLLDATRQLPAGTKQQQLPPLPEAANEGDGEANNREPPTCPFGVELNENTRTAARGRQSAGFNGSQVSWDLFRALLTRYPDFCPRQQLGRDAWTSDPGEEPVYRAITALRKLVQPLGLGVENKRLIGYRLIELPKKASPERPTRGRSAGRRR